MQFAGLAGRTDGTRVRGHVWVASGHPRSAWCAAAFRERLLAAWPVRQLGSAPSDACGGGRGLRRWGLQRYLAGAEIAAAAAGDKRRMQSQKENAEREAKSL